jgi:hypothetical protein
VTADTTGVPSVTITYTTPTAGGGSGSNGAGNPVGAVETTIDAHPAKVIETGKEKANVRFRFSATQGAAGFLCKLDSAAFAPCTSPKRYRVLRGAHTFKVKAAGDPTPATFSFRVKRKS